MNENYISVSECLVLVTYRGHYIYIMFHYTFSFGDQHELSGHFDDACRATSILLSGDNR